VRLSTGARVVVGTFATREEAERACTKHPRNAFHKANEAIRQNKPFFVYFVQEGTSGPVKIGRTKDVAGARPGVQTGNPTELRHLASERATKDREKILHRKFHHLRIRGEWFTPAPELLAYVAALMTRERASLRADMRASIARLRALADQLEASLGSEDG
jgi:hypothetical protein